MRSCQQLYTQLYYQLIIVIDTLGGYTSYIIQ